MVKNKLRSMGMKNPIVMTAGYEAEGEKIDEIAPVAPLVAGAAALGTGAYLLDRVRQGMQKDRNDVTSPPTLKAKPETIKSNIQTRNQQLNDLLNQSYRPEGKLVDEARDEFRSLGRADKNSGRNRYMGSATPQQEREENAAAEAAAKRAKAQLARNLAREAARKKRG